jgi:hypothetical protein
MVDVLKLLLSNGRLNRLIKLIRQDLLRLAMSVATLHEIVLIDVWFTLVASKLTTIIVLKGHIVFSRNLSHKVIRGSAFSQLRL